MKYVFSEGVVSEEVRSLKLYPTSVAEMKEILAIEKVKNLVISGEKKFPKNSLAAIYFENQSDTKTYGSIIEFFSKYEESFAKNKNSLLNALQFLAFLNNIDFQLKTVHGNPKKARRAIREWLFRNYPIEDIYEKLSTRDLIYLVMNKLRKEFDKENKLEFSFINMQEIKPKKLSPRFLLNRYLDRKKLKQNVAKSSAKLRRIFLLGEIPRRNDFLKDDSFKGAQNLGLVVSTVNPDELLARDIISPSTFLMRGIEQICLPLFIDHGRMYRTNPRWYKSVSPLTHTEFKDQNEWNSYLDLLYKDIYYATLLTAEKIKTGSVYFHCKDGKGPSVIVLAVYYMLHPEVLPDKDQRSYHKHSSDGCKLDIIWSFMCERCPFIASDNASKLAVLDCLVYINELQNQLEPSINKVRKHFNDCNSEVTLERLSTQADVLKKLGGSCAVGISKNSVMQREKKDNVDKKKVTFKDFKIPVAEDSKSKGLADFELSETNLVKVR